MKKGARKVAIIMAILVGFLGTCVYIVVQPSRKRAIEDRAAHPGKYRAHDRDEPYQK